MIRPTDDPARAAGTRLVGFLTLFAALYALVIVLLAGRLSLWVDEILDLMGNRNAPDLRRLLGWIATIPGGAPLGFLSQRLCLSLFGAAPLVARLPSIAASLLACAGLLIVARQLRLKAGALALVLFALLPLQFRYACEGRPYCQALALSVAATAAFLGLRARPGLKMVALYALLLTAAVYTQPFAAFVGIAHLLWCRWSLDRSEHPKVLGHAVAANAVAAFAFLPWLAVAYPHWEGAITPAGYSASSILGIMLREVCGSYAICALVLLGAAQAVRTPLPGREPRPLLWFLVAVPMAGALLADALSGYYVAARQFIFVLPAIALLAAEGFRTLLSTRAVAGRLLLGALVIALLVQDAKTFLGPREDWAQAAAAIQARTPRRGCVLAPEWPFYVFFRPDIEHLRRSEDFDGSQAVILAVTHYTTPSQLDEAHRSLESHGFVPDAGVQVSGITRIQTFRRRVPQIRHARPIASATAAAAATS
jgi:hypothetical protein